MEKCTYCVQRISRARRDGREGRPARSRDGEVVTACQAACPTRAITLRRPAPARIRASSRTAAGAASLRAARPSQHPAAHHLSGAVRNPNPKLAEDERMSARRCATPIRPAAAGRDAMPSITATIADPVLNAAGLARWWIGARAVAALLDAGDDGRDRPGCSSQGIGIWGNNTTVVWGFAIANYVWWIGIGNAGTLISALLLLTRQHWRASINRFAEAMTLFAVVDRRAVSDPPSRAGRMYFYWLAPYPNTMDAVAAMAQRAGLGFLGDRQLHPVLDPVLVCRADPRPRRRCATGRGSRRGSCIYGAFALGWRGSARHWRAAQTLLPRPWRRSPCRSWSRCTASSASISPPA